MDGFRANLTLCMGFEFTRVGRFCWKTLRLIGIGQIPIYMTIIVCYIEQSKKSKIFQWQKQYQSVVSLNTILSTNIVLVWGPLIRMQHTMTWDLRSDVSGWHLHCSATYDIAMLRLHACPKENGSHFWVQTKYNTVVL